MSEPSRWHIGGEHGPWVIKLFPHAWPDVTVCEVVVAGVWEKQRHEVGVRLQVPERALQHTMADVPAAALGLD